MREPLGLTPEEQEEDRAFFRLYGSWASLDLDGARTFFEGFDRPWWVVGGWAIEAFTGARREHEDIDVSMLACDVPALREFVGDRWHLWSNVSGTLRPLTDRHPDLPVPDCQIWVRRDAASPWVMDMPLSPDVDGLWQSKRMSDHVAPVDEVTWVTNDGLRVADPEIVLLHKGAQLRPKDRRDLDHTLPLLGEDRCSWLHDSLRQCYGDEHPWLELTRTDTVGRCAD